MCQPRTLDQSIQQKFYRTREELANALVERDQEVDILLTSLICRENPLLIGPPGTGKSMLIDGLLSWMEGTKFSILFSKFSMPEEIFGPISLSGLKNDKFIRITEGKLPCADIAFGDEIFNASSGILNTLLKILNERIYEQGDGTRIQVPLKLFVGAANQWPHDQEGGKELHALFDRFLLRKRVLPILSKSGRQRLWWNQPSEIKLSSTISPIEIDVAQKDSIEIPWTEEAKQAFESIIHQLAREGIFPGDRRQAKAIKAVQAYCYLDGKDQVETEHLQILSHILWEDPNEQPEKVSQVVAKIANPIGMKVNSLVLEIEQILSASDFKQLAQAAIAASKLQEIEKQLQAVGNHSRAAKARKYVREQVRKIKLASIEAI